VHRIDVNDIRCFAFHGCLPSESKIGTNYKVSVSAFGDYLKACETDNLELTVDYCIVSDIVVEEMATPSKLIEHVALRILKRLKKAYSDSEFDVCIMKVSAPINQNVGNVAFTLSSKDCKI
jgi:dihydroneopterin aldolase